MKATVSIIVPCYNQAQYLDEALQSVLDQTYSNWECIIVNDGSPDNTEEVAKKWLELDCRFKYIYQENSGLSAARNAGISSAKGEFILPLDSDDFFENSYLEKAVTILRKDANVGAVTCYVKCFVNSGEVTYRYEPKGGEVMNFIYRNNSNANSLFRKEIWISIGGYDELMKNGYEDWEFWIAVTMKGYKIEVIPEYLFNYRKNLGSMLEKSRQSYDESIKKYILLKHKSLYLIDFEKTIDFLQSSTIKYKKNEIKRINSLDFKLGKYLLTPLRFIKSLFRG